MGVQVFNGMLSLVNPAYGGSVGWWAHIGGFLSGAALAALARRCRAGRAGGAALNEMATPAGDAAGAGREAAPRPGPRPAGTLLGKPLTWSSRWTAVVAIVAVCACFLGVARLQMGHLTAFSAREAAAVAEVERARLTDGQRYGDLLSLLRRPARSACSASRARRRHRAGMRSTVRGSAASTCCGIWATG